MEITEEDLQRLKKAGTSTGESGKKKKKQGRRKGPKQPVTGEMIEGSGGQEVIKTMEKSEMFGDPSNLKRKLEFTTEEHLRQEPESNVNVEFKAPKKMT